MNYLMKDHFLITHTVPQFTHTPLSRPPTLHLFKKILKEYPRTHVCVVTLQQRAASLTCLEIETLIEAQGVDVMWTSDSSTG